MTRRFQKLELLEQLCTRYSSLLRGQERAVLVSVQHLLETTGSLIETLVHLGFVAEDIFITGKLYSTNSEVENRLEAMQVKVYRRTSYDKLGHYKEALEADCSVLWETVETYMTANGIEHAVVLDDGGTLIKTMPYGITDRFKVIGIEQTTSGIDLNLGTLNFPVVNVAGSAVKKLIEPAFISQAVVRKIRHCLFQFQPKRIGVIGFGSIGRALVLDLVRAYEVMVFDHTIEKLRGVPENAHSVYHEHELFEACDMIIGATGKDISRKEWLDAQSDKVLISVSSGDVEFNRVLKIIGEGSLSSDVLADVEYTTAHGAQLLILRGGTPVNFDNNIHSVLPEHIQLTRALLLLGVVQAQIFIGEKGDQRTLKLDCHEQTYIMRKWASLVNLDACEFEVAPALLTEELLCQYSAGRETVKVANLIHEEKTPEFLG